MRNVYEVLRQRRADLARAQHDVDALELVIPLLIEAEESKPVELPEDETGSGTEGTGTDGPMFSSIGRADSSFWRRK